MADRLSLTRRAFRGISFVWILSLFIAGCGLTGYERGSEKLTALEKATYFKSADLVFEGTFRDMREEGTSEDAIARAKPHPDVWPWHYYSFEVQKVLKGQWNKTNFTIKAEAGWFFFGDHPQKPGRLFTIYLQLNPNRPGHFLMTEADFKDV